ncbi:hypothetical protein HAALTHF_30880n [Vreelandella aquamarina]|nr:hypothetical protein HAALTHF_30880n [Halomonas axialensis]
MGMYWRRWPCSRGLRCSAFPSPRDALSGDVARAAELATAAGVGFEEWHPHTTLAGEVIVDALLGTGLSGEVEGSIKQAIKAMNTASQPVLALDIPSGISADTGAMLGTAVEATCTVTFIGDKIGLHTGDAPAYTGDIDFRPLGVKAQAFLIFHLPLGGWMMRCSARLSLHVLVLVIRAAWGMCW